MYKKKKRKKKREKIDRIIKRINISVRIGCVRARGSMQQPSQTLRRTRRLFASLDRVSRFVVYGAKLHRAMHTNTHTRTNDMQNRDDIERKRRGCALLLHVRVYGIVGVVGLRL